MRKLTLRFLIVTVTIVVLQLVLAGCRTRGQAVPTMNSITLTNTPMLDAPEIPETPQAAVATTTPSLTLGERQTIEDSFSFRPITGFSVKFREDGVIITSEDASIYLLLMTVFHPETESLEDELLNCIASPAGHIERFEMGKPFPIIIDGIGGLAVDFVGLYSDEPITGRMEIAFLDNARSFTVFGFAVDGLGSDRGETEGDDVFNAIVDSVAFSEPLPALGSPRAAEMVKAVIEASIVSGQARTFFHTIENDLVFGISYTTSLDPQTQADEFYDEFNLVVFIASEGFVRTDSESVLLIVMAGAMGSSMTPDNPPLAQVVVDRLSAENWVEGHVSDETFIESWIVVPLPDS